MAADGVHKQGLPMDVMLEIAWGTDPETVVRCAATCKDFRRRIIEPSSSRGRRRLRLRRGDVPSILGGQLIGKWGEDLYLEDKASNLIPTGCLLQSEKGRCVPVPIAARGGLVLVRLIHEDQPPRAAAMLRVCCPATGRVQSLPPGPKFKGQFVLLVGEGHGGGAVGRPFKVVNVASVYAGLVHRNRRHCFEIQTFSSERGTWGPPTRIQDQSFFNSSCSLPPLPGRHMVVGGAIYWVCRNGHQGWYYVFKLDNAGLASKRLPPSFHRECELSCPGPQQILLAATAGGSPVVLVANLGMISAWTMSNHTASWREQPHESAWPSHRTTSAAERTASWTDQPHVVVEYEAIRSFGNVQGSLGMVQLEWFAERSGIVQLSTKRCGFFWLHLQSRKIIRHFPGSLYTRSCPYETVSSWVPTLGTLR
ncbi:unnamed protein product [Urochloa decumbens]|uniref:DUF7595 domain-containing protein n=1 Tax=Urochloa decumbens TaxID=240449 RepID=A0ABC8W7V6_9POAL